MKSKVYKFGGASVKDAAGIRNTGRILQDYGVEAGLVLVVSAMGKTPNALEQLWRLAMDGLPFQDALRNLKFSHEQVELATF